MGWLAPFRYLAPPGVDPAGLHSRAGDYIPAEAAALVDRPAITGDVIQHYLRYVSGKRAIAFCASVAHSQHVAAQFQAAGIPARHVDGTTPADERRQAMADFRSGKLNFLTNVNLFLEGVDVPALEAVHLLSPTRSLAKYLQAVGRALRPAEGKTAIILDHVSAVQMHGLPDEPRQWTLLGRDRRKAAANDNEVPPAIRTCENCYAAFKPAPTCPYCGTISKPSPREIQQIEGELAELKRAELETVRLQARKQQGQARTVEDLVAIAKARGYKNPAFWAMQVMRGRGIRAIM
jgi:superfamily II DNA or RNA helicase